MNRRTLGAGLFVALLAIPCGCDLFQTRDPEPPSQTTSTFDPPTTYDKVVRNLQFAIADKNLKNYASCFVDSSIRPFVFIGAEDARRGFADVMDHWSLESEQRYFQNLKELTPGIPSLTIPDRPPTFVGTDSVIYDLDYSLSYPHSRAGAPQLVRGTMQLHLAAYGGLWSINYWRDSKTTSDSTWSYLKAVFSG